jgi:hypothetical protein
MRRRRAKRKAPRLPRALFSNRRSICYFAHLQVSHLQQAQGAHLHASHLQQLWHFSCACVVSAVPIRVIATNAVIRIVLIISPFRFQRFETLQQLNQEKMGGRKSGESVRPVNGKSELLIRPERAIKKQKADSTGSADSDGTATEQPQF